MQSLQRHSDNCEMLRIKLWELNKFYLVRVVVPTLFCVPKPGGLQESATMTSNQCFLKTQWKRSRWYFFRIEYNRRRCNMSCRSTTKEGGLQRNWATATWTAAGLTVTVTQRSHRLLFLLINLSQAQVWCTTADNELCFVMQITSH